MSVAAEALVVDTQESNPGRRSVAGRPGAAAPAPRLRHGFGPRSTRLRVSHSRPATRPVDGARASVTTLLAPPAHQPRTAPRTVGPQVESTEWSTATHVDLRLRADVDAPAPVRAAESVRASGPVRAVSPSARRVSLELSTDLRLTRRGMYAIAGLVAAAAIALCGMAWLSAPSEAAPASSVPAVVTVQPGDTLWSIAENVAPQRDPRDVVHELREINSLASVELKPGQVIRTH